MRSRYTVVGVMPPGVQHPGNDYHALADGDTVDLWLPFSYEGDPNRARFAFHGGNRAPEARRFARAGKRGPERGAFANGGRASADKGWRVFLVPLYREMVGRTQRMLLVLFWARWDCCC